MGGVVGDLGSKDLPQSRLHQWTMQPSGGPDPFPGGPGSPLDPNPSKFGPGSIPIGPPPKPSLDDGPFNHYDLGGDPVRPSGSLGDGWPRDKSPGDKMANGTNSSISWPPEFRPGEPWKGLQNIDPDNDPDITPGSVIGSGLTVSTSMRDVDRFMLRDRNPGPSPSLNTALPSSSAWSYSASNTSYGYSSPTPALNSSAKPGGELKGSSWPVSNTHTPTTLTHELWKVPLPTKNSTAPSRPPPGLPNPKNPSPWGTGGSLGLAGPGWAAESSSSGRASTWLVLRNLTPQIDGSTLRTLCMQHGPLTTFHLNLPHGNALVKYSSLEEAGKAQKSLHMCVLGNTTIVAEFASEEEISRYFAQGQASASPVSSWQQPRSGVGSGPHGFPRGSAPGSTSGTGTSVASSGSSGAPGGSAAAAAGGGGGGGSSELGHWASQPGEASSLWGLPQYPSGGLWGTAGGEEGRGIASPSPLLPNDLLGNESM